jgi:hypothetical protein
MFDFSHSEAESLGDFRFRMQSLEASRPSQSVLSQWGHVPLTKICATFPRGIETMASLCGIFFSISGDVRGISSASLWSRIFNIRLLISETRFELAWDRFDVGR